jgi:transposase
MRNSTHQGAMTGEEMARPSEIDQAFAELKPDWKLLNRLIKKEQKDYIRKRLKAIRGLWQGKCRQEVIDQLDIDRTSLLNRLKIMIEHGVASGLNLLAQPKKVKRAGKLEVGQQENLIDILENDKPTAYGYEQNIFTGKILAELVEQKWQVTLSDQTIYNILHRHNFSYQRGHRDYDNADPLQQQAYARVLKVTLANKAPDERIVFFDEFSVTNRPTTFYGWARVNTKFKVPSNEKKKRERLNGLLSVDADTGQEHIKLTPKAKTENLVDYFYDLALDTHREGYNQLTIIPDNNSTHKDKMRYHLWLKAKAHPELQDFYLKFINSPSYSPNFNLAEYIIHQLRLTLLHHLPADVTLANIETKIINFFKDNQLQTPQQIANTINHILKLGGLECGI